MQGHYINGSGWQHGGSPYVPANPDRTNGVRRNVKKALLVGCNYNEHQQGTLDVLVVLFPLNLHTGLH